MKDKIFEYVRENYGCIPDYPWESSPECAVLRHTKSRKWFALFMEVKRSVFGLGEGMVWVVNLKCHIPERECLIAEGKAFPAYHMNKKQWTSVLLDGSVDEASLFNLMDQSYEMTQ